MAVSLIKQKRSPRKKAALLLYMMGYPVESFQFVETDIANVV